MIVLRLVPILILFLLMAGQFMLSPGQVYATWCCECGTECSVLNIKSWFCTCPGTSPFCPYCQKSDSASFEAKSPIENGVSDIGSVSRSTVTKSVLTGSMVGQMRGGECASRKLSLRLLAHAGDGLKFEPAAFDDNSIRDQTVAFHTTPEK